EISVQFENGYGLAAGDVVKHRGIVIGEVTSVELNTKFRGVEVRVRLNGRATGLARAGSQFWVERPRLSVAEIRGLETLVGGRYLAVLPGPSDAESRRSFVGLESAPAGELPAGGLEILLQGSAKGGMEPGTPVHYRGQKVGQIVSVGLANDAASVDARAYIQPDFRNLVCDNSRFWMNSGLRMRFGFSGLEVGTDTLSNLAMGGVSFGTPTDPGLPVTTGHRFVIADEPESAWEDWEPRIAVGTGFLREGLSFPTPERVTLRWTESFLGISRTKRRQGWVLPLNEGRILLGPADLLTPANEKEGDTILEVSGREFPILKGQSQVSDGVAFYPVEGEPISPQSAWPPDRTRTPNELESAMLVADPQTAKLPLPTERLSKTEGTAGWIVDPSVPLDAAWHGGCLISINDGKLVGIVLTSERPARIAFIPSLPKTK
ncbi:MAG: MCE family protein, partial [Planctomycetaceae bacterium]|nr:MCE family protein [Planctomycetaceae bacterium]